MRHLSRQKFIAQFVIGLIKSRNGQFGEVAQHLNDQVKVASNETRIQDFFREVTLDYRLLAHLLLSLLPTTGKLRLRRLLDNRSGNSSAADRIGLRQTCVHVLGKHRIKLVLGDREFVGHVWLKWLKDNGLNFVMRLPKHHQLTCANGRRTAVTDLGLAVEQVRRLAHVQVDGVWGQVWVKALAEGDFLFLFGNVGLPYMDQLYARRWTIEQCFQNLKGRGFNLEASHLRCRHKLRKLVALVSLAYALCLSVGTVAHAKRAPIARKNHGYYATSLSRHGSTSCANSLALPRACTNRWPGWWTHCCGGLAGKSLAIR